MPQDDARHATTREPEAVSWRDVAESQGASEAELFKSGRPEKTADIAQRCPRLTAWAAKNSFLAFSLVHLVVLTALAWCGLAAVLVLLAFGMVLFIAPLGAGSGLPETKGFLNGTKVKGLFSPRTLLVRALGVVLVVSATLPVGREQPLIEAGGCLEQPLPHHVAPAAAHGGRVT